MSDGITNRLFNESDPNLRPTVPPGDTRLTDEGENGHNRQTTLGRRFVQLPTDTERSSKTGYLAASSAVVTLEHHHPIRQEELLGSLFALLHRYTQQTNIALDVCIRNGATACQIALDVEVASDLPASSVIESARLAFLIAIPPLVDMGRPSNIAASLTLASSETGGGLDTVTDAPSSNNNYDAHFILTQTPAAVLISLAYNARLLRPATVSRLIGSYIALLKATLNDHTITIEQLPLLSPEEKQALAVGLDSGAAFHPLVPAHRLFESQARQQPTVVAASFQGHHLTYRDLDERSSQLAHHLITCGVGPEIPVAVCLQPCLDVLVAMLAIWKARGIYLPLDPSHPEAFIGRMLDETQPRLALTTATLSGLTGRLPHFCFDTDAELIQKQPRTAPPIQPSLTDPAYIFYTSGTTGKAKGVVALHSNLVQYIQSAAQKYNFSATDTFASIARYTFSISLFELMSPLCCGGNLRILDRNEVLSPERLCRALKDVTVLHAGPSLLGSLFRYLDATRSAPRTFPRMRHASSGGDMVTPKVMEGMKRVFPNAELFVIYGCTEVSCMGTSYSIDREATVNRTIVGKPFSNVMLRIVDSNRNLVPFGV
ncbi:MAG TPA: AMP-binding protein, partial [Telmatospirillum sp.]|nr:AMP-binding protein [Telmatospirillum sp.]